MSTLELVVTHDRNRELLAGWLGDTYAVETVESPSLGPDVDCCIIDEAAFAAHQDALETWKSETDPVFTPVLLLSEEPPNERFDPSDWETIDGLYVVDDVVTPPLDRTVFYRRLENLLERRDLSVQLHRQYRRSEERFSALFRALPDPALVVSDDGTIRYANDAFRRLFDLADDVTGRLLGTIEALDDARAAIEECIAAAHAGGIENPIEATVVDAAGSTRHLELAAAPMTVDAECTVAIVMRDVTARVKRARDLRESEERFRQIVAQVEETIWMVDADTLDLLYISPGVEQLTGRSAEHFADDPIETFVRDVHPEDREAVQAEVAEWLADVERGEPDEDYHFEFRYCLPDDSVSWLHVDAAVVTDDSDEPDRMVGIIDDVTELKEREADLERQNERLEEFTGIVSHDLRNPLQVILGRTTLLRETVDDTAAVDEIERAADRMEQLIDDLLTLAREGDDVDDVEALSLEVSAGQAWGSIDGPRASFSVVDGGMVEADSSRLRQLFENLFRNSVEHAGPDVAVEVGLIRDGGDPVGFYVEDDGPGIPPAEREKVFAEGYTTSSDGTGLGLDIVGAVADAHGWSVAVTESDDGGARFEFTDVALA